MNELSTDKITLRPEHRAAVVYVGAGKSDANPEAIIAYSPSDMNGRAVAFADGSVQVMSAEKFQEALQRDAALPRVETALNAQVASQAAAAALNQAAAPIEAPARPAAQPGGQAAILANQAPPAAPPPAAAPGAGGFGGGMGGGGFAPPQAKPTATGVRPIRIEVPRTGQSFTFTKVLNASKEPLTASFSTTRLKVYRGRADGLAGLRIRARPAHAVVALAAC